MTEKQWEIRDFLRESALQNYVQRRLKEIPNCKFFKAADKFTSGISDLVGCVNGKFVAIELKVRDNKPTKLQEYFLSEIKNSGGVFGVARTWLDVKKILNQAGANLKIENDEV